jgi:hypothetical protein
MRAMRSSILCLFLFGLACSKSEPTTSATEAPPGGAPAAPEQAATTADEAGLAEPSIALLSPGAEPRRVLRWTFEKGSKETMKIWSQVTMIAQMGIDDEKTTVTPPVVHTLALEVQGVEPDGSTTVGFEVKSSMVLKDKKAYASTREKMMEAASSIRGLKGTYRVDASGIVTDFELPEAAEGESRDLRMAESIGEFLSRSTVPVPGEAVGKGGTWTVKRRLVEGGITVDQTSTYELQKLDGSKIAVGVKTEKSAPDQEVGTPGTYGHFNLKHFATTGQGERQADLGKLVPQKAASKTDTELKTFMQKKDGLALQQDLTIQAQERITAP